MPAKVPPSRAAYWKEREVRWQDFAAKNGPNYAAFSTLEKPFAAAARAKEKGAKPKTGKTANTAAASAGGSTCSGGKKPKMVFGTPRCAKQENKMSDILTRMRQLAGIESTQPSFEEDAAPVNESDDMEKMSTALEPVIALAKKMNGSKGLGDALKRLLNAAVEVRHLIDG